MIKTKAPLQSLTIWASLGVFLLAVLQVIGIPITEAESAEAVGHVQGIITAVLALLAIYGRVRARSKIDINAHAPKLLLWALIASAAVGSAGCDAIGGTHWLDNEGVTIVGQPASSSRMNPDGDQTGVTMGGHPTLIKSDNEGIWKNTSGPTRTLTLVPATGQIFTDSTDDLQIAEFAYTPQPRPGEPQLVIRGLTSGQTAVIEAQSLGYRAAYAALEGMTREQAAAVVEKWKTAGVVTEGVARAVIAALFPPAAAGTASGVLGGAVDAAAEAAQHAADAAGVTLPRLPMPPPLNHEP